MHLCAKGKIGTKSKFWQKAEQKGVAVKNNGTAMVELGTYVSNWELVI
jgi:hypothetical protein